MVPIWRGDKRLFLSGTGFWPALVHNFPWVAWMKYTYREGIPIPLAKSCVYSWTKQFREKKREFDRFCCCKRHSLNFVVTHDRLISLQWNKKSQVSAFVTIFLHPGKKNEWQFLLKTSWNHWGQTTWNSSIKVFSNHPFREFRQKMARDIRLVH